jgi:hypothetical protein
LVDRHKEKRLALHPRLDIRWKKIRNVAKHHVPKHRQSWKQFHYTRFGSPNHELTQKQTRRGEEEKRISTWHLKNFRRKTERGCHGKETLREMTREYRNTGNR